MKAILTVFVFLATGLAAGADTNHAKCRASALAKRSWWGSQIKLLEKTGKVTVKTWITRSDDRAFGPTIYNHMWYSMKNGKMIAQVCARCYRNRIQEDDAYQDGGGFEYIKDVVRCDLDDDFN